MSSTDPEEAAGRAAPPASEDGEPEQRPENTAPDDGDGGERSAADEPEQAQSAWRARQDLLRHRPSFTFGQSARFDGDVVGGDQHTLTGGRVEGDVIVGQTVYQLGTGRTGAASGEIPADTLDELAACFSDVQPGDTADGGVLDRLVERLRSERLLVLAGPRHSGRRSAALVLLHRLGVETVRALDRDTPPGELAARLDASCGYLLGELDHQRTGELREAQLMAAREALVEHDGHLVVITGPEPRLEHVTIARWYPPPARHVLHAHLRHLTDETAAGRLVRHPAVEAFLHHAPQPREVAAFAELAARHVRGEEGEEALADFSRATVERQVQEWFDDPELHLRDKAFLVALAVFDEAPYALTAELGDLLYALLQRTEDPLEPPRVPVFGTSVGSRVKLARARTYTAEEPTEWGPVPQLNAAFEDRRAALVLLREVWTGHPSARPGLIGWLRELADDGRPLVRTRAAAAAAVLTARDLPSAMALLVHDWATSPRPHRRIVAVNTLALAHAMGAPGVPRIVRSWCGADEPFPLRWTAVRAYALLGEERPTEALRALRDAAAGEDSHDQRELLAEAAESAALLLLSDARAPVLAQLLDAVTGERSARDFALRAFLAAAGWSDGEPGDTGSPHGRPELLDRYGQAAARDSAADAEERHGIAVMWRAALRDHRHTRAALAILGDWLRVAEDDPTAEWALAALLPALVEDATDHARLTHRLRTVPPDEDGRPRQAAARLLAHLSFAPAR
ncbi:hypothetical protein [Streptomyces alkaliterrae]|uniref:Uncharacterized protein n=1 Tax=Streptomyces alkaliterrae TaxID=2213162 RepID=A0A5P0YSY4_9ACTN|nr:hypothetical protein [Streptomyces alkaliterrae]MBB1261003.1 hypothetical protein [Streptomyces alkaliterrae]MQS03426.1 hypothetical protein [Streptomyces alkaliterrae]